MTWLPVARDIIVTLAAVATAYAALRGLSVWRRELHTRRIMERVSLLLDRVLELRETIKDARQPFVGEAEKAHAFEEAGEKPNSNDFVKLTDRADALVRNRRRNLLVISFNAVKTASIQVEAACGKESIQSLAALEKLIRKLAYVLESYDRLVDPKFQTAEKIIDYRVIAYSSADPDFFGGDVDAAIENVVDDLRNLLRACGRA